MITSDTSREDFKRQIEFMSIGVAIMNNISEYQRPDFASKLADSWLIIAQPRIYVDQSKIKQPES